MALAQFHIVTAMQEIRGNENHALFLRELLAAAGVTVKLWSDRDTPYARQAGATVIQAFSGQLPRGGTLILLGTSAKLEPWIGYARPERTILMCNTSDAMPFYATLSRLKQTGIDVEVAYVSTRLREAMQWPGYRYPLLIDLELFHPRAPGSVGNEKRLTIGRHSRDTPEKHHPADPSLYRMLAWQNWRIRLMGATCLAPAMADCPNAELLPTGAEAPAAFLRSLDVFFYRTHPSVHEAAGRIVLEAMACALPVVAHVSGGYTDWIRHGENGLLFETQEEAWLLLRELEQNGNLRQRLGQTARVNALELAGPTVRQAYLDWLLHNRDN